MSLTLHYHPLSSFCWKVLVGLYENETAFTPKLVNLGDADSRAAFLALWPVGKFPVLEDTVRGAVVPESSIILDYLDLHRPAAVRFTPADPEAAWRTRLWDRLIDSYIHYPMQRVVADRIRAPDARDPQGVAEAKAQMATGCGLLERQLAQGPWVMGEAFGLADCAAAPALHYADRIAPLAPSYPALAAYLARIGARPSFRRVLEEAAPYAHMFPSED